MSRIVDPSFFERNPLDLSRDLLGKILVRKYPDKSIKQYKIVEVEAYVGIIDLASHSSKGRTRRTEILYHSGGHIYMYLIYGIHWMLNVVGGKIDEPHAVLVRGLEGFIGPGRLTKALGLDKSFYGEHLIDSERIWIEDHPTQTNIITSPRVGIDYAGEPWISKPWRFRILP